MSAEEKNKLDEIFKSGLDLPDTRFDYHDQDWDDMEQLLDAGKKPRGVIYWLPMLSGVAAILLLVLGWWFFKPANVEQQVATVKHLPVAKPANPANNSGVNSTVMGDNSPKADQHTNKAAAQTAPVYAGTSVKPANHLPVKPSAGSHNNTTVIADNFGSPITPDAAIDLLANTSGNPEPQQKPIDNGTTAVNATSNSIAAVETPVKEVQKDVPIVADATPAIAGNKKVKRTIQPAGGRRGPQIGLAILVSPDINGVKSFQDAKVGTNVGLLFSVGITKRLSISTGASYSKKPYMTDFDNYHTSYKFKTDPDNVLADCRVLDIPLNVDYKVYGSSRNSFSVGSGLSSYIMLSEKYTYDYGTSGASGPAGYSVTNRNKHILGVLNINATYQHQLNSKFSIAAQPYLKIPLTNIGYSQVKLQSAGVAVGLRWNINQSITP